MAARLVLVPTSLTFSQWRPWPGFWNRALYAWSPGVAAAELDEQVEVAVAVPVGEGDAVPLLEVAGAGRRR